MMPCATEGSQDGCSFEAQYGLTSIADMDNLEGESTILPDSSSGCVQVKLTS